MNQTLITQNTAKPTRKVKAGILAGKIITVAFGIVALVNPEFFDRIPAGFELAVGGLATSLVQDIVSYMTKDTV